MKINKFITLSLLFLLGVVNIYAQKVSNISSRQEQNTIIVSYDLDTPTPCKISLYVSTDGGNNWQGPLKKIDNNYTESVTKGTHEVIWKVLEEFEELSGDNIVFQVKADSNNETKKSNYLPDTNQKKIYLAEIEKLNKTIKLNPKNANAYKTRAALRRKFRSGQWDDLAILDYTKLILINPNDASAYKARAVLRINDYKNAIKDINKSILLNPNDSQNFIIRGEIIKRVLMDSIVGLSYQDAINDYNQSIDLNPKEGLSYLFRARCKFELKEDYTGAISDLDKALALGFNYIELSHNLVRGDYFASCYFVKGKIYYLLSNKTDLKLINESFENLNTYLSINDSTLSKYSDLYNIIFIDDDNNLLKFLNQFISKFPTEEYAYELRSIIEIGNNDFTKAEADINQFLDLAKNKNRKMDMVTDLQFVDYLKDKNQNSLAINLLDKTIKLFPIYDTYYKRGELKAELKDYFGAVKDYTEAISFETKKSDTYFQRGSARQELNDYIGAMEDYSKAIIFDPEESFNYYARGNAKYNLKDNRGAILDYSKAISLDPDSSYYYNGRGNAKYNIKDYKGAILDYTKAISLDPNEGEYYFNRGDAKIQIKDKIGGCKDLSKAGELGYEEAYSLINEQCN
jgi:tetratricopeptide (TPR) repeat protein